MSQDSKGNYSDARYMAKQVLSFTTTGSLAGTESAAADLFRKQVMYPTRVLDAVGYYTAGGTDAGVLKVTINTSLAGTGALVAIGTMVIGTQATASSKAITVTETALTDGDQIVLSRAAGTSAIVADVLIDIAVREQFEA